MQKNVRRLLAVCLLAIAGVIVLQFFWIKNYYNTSLFNFEREINLAFEDAIKKEFQLRNDTIEQLTVEKFMDTSAFIIGSEYWPEVKQVVHYIYEAKCDTGRIQFSNALLPDLLKEDDTAYKRKIAQTYAHSVRINNLENNVIFYRASQTLGRFIEEKVQQYNFDTSRLRPLLKQYLEQRNIYTKFYFHISSADSLLNYIKPPDEWANKNFVITKAHPTHKWGANDEKFVRAVFENPAQYVIAKMKWTVIGSLLLIVAVAFCIWLLLRALFHEKKLAAMKNDFIHNITHELKTPVATISAAVEALQDFDLNREKHSRYLKHAKNETIRLTKLIDNILNISLYGKNKMPVQPEQIPVQETINDIVENLKIATDKTVRYQFENNSGINFIFADKQLFQQAVTNVLDNAVKYSGSEVEINISCTADNRYFTICCADKGEGIAASSMLYIFEKFYREPKSGHAVKGYGLGLNYVQEIIRAHNGKIEISSTKGKGTTVILSFPV